MHDGALQYEPDTVVLDLDDEPSRPIAVGRTPSTEIVMHVLLLGERHRRVPDADETSCGVPFHIMQTPTRREQLTHVEAPLCADCFTPHEIRRATANDLANIEREEREVEEERQRRDEFFASIRKKRPSQGDK